MISLFRGIFKKEKKWQVTYIAPLQPLTLAAFPPWGSSAGAGRARPAGAKIRECVEGFLQKTGTFIKKNPGQ